LILEQLLRSSRDLLVEHGIYDASLEAEVLLRHILKISRSQLYVEFNREARYLECRNYQNAIDRRLAGEPTAYITGHREFFGLDFEVDHRVLIPRPETEILVEKAIQIAGDRNILIADIGTGSGAIAISLAVSLIEDNVNIYATDLSQEALEVAYANCRKHGVENRVRLFAGDLLEPLPEPVDIIIANLPYVRKDTLCNVNTSGFEPSLALDGGYDGLDQIRRLCSQFPGKLNGGGAVLLEIGYNQSEAVISFLNKSFPYASIESFRDLAGLPRMITLSVS
jgi:release factor glutamine methyltransferase